MGGERSKLQASEYALLNYTPKGQNIRSIYTDRLRNFTSAGQYEKYNLVSALDSARTGEACFIDIKVWSAPGQDRPLFKDAIKHDFSSTRIGERFGPSWTSHWFKFEIKVPEKWNYPRVQFEFDCESEGMVYTTDGEPMQGLTGGNGGDRRHEFILPKSWHSGTHTFYIEAGMNGMFGNALGDIIQPPDNHRYFTLRKADLVAPNEQARALWEDFHVISDCARELPQDSWESHLALNVGNEIMTAFETKGGVDAIPRCREIARTFLGPRVDSDQVYKSGTGKPLVSGIGHCHVDLGWLWPFAETKRKLARSWSTQIDLMERYPEHRFTCSQAQAFKWVKQDYPALFSRIRNAVKRGTFEPIGGSWVEMDANMPSGEALVRQFLYAQRFFERQFGSKCKVFWLPDTFGYCVQLPQICRLAAMNYGFTQKLSWNNINTFPHTSFNWVSPDGTQLMMHMCPAETYAAQGDVGELIRSVRQHKSLGEEKRSLLVFGNGDGGGGPLASMLEKLRRCRGVSDTVGCLPRVDMGSTVYDFYRQLEKDTDAGKSLSTWHGELYLELHRGCYTTQSHTKKNNRQSEVLLHDVEFLATIASLYVEDYKFPKAEIDSMWENVLLCQFHDVLPGSAIEMVYDDAARIYKEVRETAEKCLKEAISALGLDKGDRSMLNFLPWARTEVVGDQVAKGGAIAALSAPTNPVSMEERDGEFKIKNEHLMVTISHGVITSIYDLDAQREVIASGCKAGQFVIFDDKPLYWQAWDTELYSLDTRKVLHPSSTKTAAKTAAKASVDVHYKISDVSQMDVTISLSSDSRQVEFECHVDWHESVRFLKVEFPVDVVSHRASYDTQFGVVERNTHFNTSWDRAKFEVCCHKYADLSEHNYGVAILNDCKYGFATHGNVMRLSLLRSPKAPDGHADMGEHDMRFSIMPHQGPLNVDVVRAAKEFNSPLRSIRGHSEYLDAIQLETDGAVILDTIKRGEDDADVSVDRISVKKGKHVILRLYESLGGKSEATIKTKFAIKSAYKTNILEEDMEKVRVSQGAHEVTLNLRAAEIYTLKLEIDPSSL